MQIFQYVSITVIIVVIVIIVIVIIDIVVIVILVYGGNTVKKRNQRILVVHTFIIYLDSHLMISKGQTCKCYTNNITTV